MFKVRELIVCWSMCSRQCIIRMCLLLAVHVGFTAHVVRLSISNSLINVCAVDSCMSRTAARCLNFRRLLKWMVLVVAFGSLWSWTNFPFFWWWHQTQTCPLTNLCSCQSSAVRRHDRHREEFHHFQSASENPLKGTPPSLGQREKLQQHWPMLLFSFPHLGRRMRPCDRWLSHQLLVLWCHG